MHHNNQLMTKPAQKDEHGVDGTPPKGTPERAMVPAPATPRHPAPREQSLAPTSPRPLADTAGATARALQEQCLKLGLSLFYREQAPLRSLAFTSAVGGEGTSLIAMLISQVLARGTQDPVTLIECNWERPCFATRFNVPAEPGLAEWLRGECSAAEIQHVIDGNLTIIPAGNGGRDGARLVQQMRAAGWRDALLEPQAVAILDLPPVITCAYTTLAAALVDSVVVVVRAGVTQDSQIAQTCAELEHLRVEGILLNQERSTIPGWLRQIL